MHDPELPSGIILTYLLLAFTLIATGATLIWSWIYRSIRSGLPVIPFEAREPVPWSMAHVMGYAILTLLLMAGYVRALAPASDNPAELSLDAMLGLAAVEVVGFAVGLVLLRLTARPSWIDLGLPSSREQARADLRLGALASVALVIPILAIQALLMYLMHLWTGEVPQHQLLESLTKNPSILDIFKFAFIAIIVAPLAEEFFFRVLLQGWLEGLVSAKEVNADDVRDAPIDSEVPRDRPAVWPVLVSSLLFAAAHAGRGPDPIPIFSLALALGYVYRQTHRFLPSLALHACFNAYSVGIILLEALK